MYNHHQTGPAGAVIFMPPFRDPFNYNFDPLIPLGIEMVGTAMHSRLVAEGKGGSAMRTGANYSTWWNGGLRTITYFHNMIGILTEIIGNPTPIDIPLVPDKQLPQGDWPLPIAPQGSGITASRSITRSLIIARCWIWRRGIARRCSSTSIGWAGIRSKRAARITGPSRRSGSTALEAAAAKMARRAVADAGRGGGGLRRSDARRRRRATVPTELYNTVLHDPKMRDPRGYIIPSDQADFATATDSSMRC